MTLVNTRAAFEKAVTDAVADVDPTVEMIYDNMVYKTPGKTKKYIMVNLDFTQATNQVQGDATSYYAGTIRCAVMTPSNKGTAAASAVSELLITGLTSVNKSTYTDTFSVTPRVSQISGPTSVVTDNQSHFMSVVNCNFTANA